MDVMEQTVRRAWERNAGNVFQKSRGKKDVGLLLSSLTVDQGILAAMMTWDYNLSAVESLSWGVFMTLWQVFCLAVCQIVTDRS